ncbi:MAG: hypothetical protein Q4P08_06235 [Eubacteriales bacterium]|nr:hypothetical protein [Eubacteriales bacterium]
MNNIEERALKESALSIIKGAEEIKEKDSDDLLELGRRLGYIEALSRMQGVILSFGLELDDYGLDFDVDEKFA